MLCCTGLIVHWQSKLKVQRYCTQVPKVKEDVGGLMSLYALLLGSIVWQSKLKVQRLLPASSPKSKRCGWASELLNVCWTGVNFSWQSKLKVQDYALQSPKELWGASEFCMRSVHHAVRVTPRRPV